MKIYLYIWYLVMSSLILGFTCATIYSTIYYQTHLTFFTTLTWITYGMVMFSLCVNLINLHMFMRFDLISDGERISDLFSSKFSIQQFSIQEIATTILVVVIFLLANTVFFKGNNQIVLNIALLFTQYIFSKLTPSQ